MAGLDPRMLDEAGARERVNQMLIQPFVNYNLPDAWYMTSAPIITAKWEADGDDRWTVPLGAGVGKIVRIGKLPVNARLADYYNVVRPDSAAEWQLRVQVQFLFPKRARRHSGDSITPSPAPSRTPPHDSGPVWVAGTSPYHSFIRNTPPV